MALHAAVLTISDRSARGERPDSSGPALVDALQAAGWQVVRHEITPDEQETIAHTLSTWCDSDRPRIDLVLTTGGTGFALRDVTPEATLAVIERAAPGLAEAMRAESMRVTPHAMLSRGVAGIRGRTLIVNLPGSPKAALENLRTIMPALPHAAALLQDDPASERGHTQPGAQPG
jgi:molybdenum cofactor synthesis domain-containing protein